MGAWDSWNLCARKISGKFRGAGSLSGMESSRNLTVPLFGRKEEKLVLFNGSAEGAAKVVPAQFGILQFRRRALVEEIVGVQGVVSAEIKERAVPVIGAMLGDDIDLSAAGLPILGTVGICYDFELVDGIQGRINENGALRAGVINRGAIHREQVPGALPAAEGNIGAALKALGGSIESILGRSARNQQRKPDKVEPIQRQLANLLPFRKHSQSSRGRIHLNVSGFHRHGFSDRADRQVRVNDKDRTKVQFNAAAVLGLEAVLFHCYVIVARRKFRKGVQTLGTGSCSSCKASFIVEGGDLRSRNVCPCGVKDRALNGPIILGVLRESRRRENQYQTAKQHAKPRPSHKTSRETRITVFVRLD